MGLFIFQRFVPVCMLAYVGSKWGALNLSGTLGNGNLPSHEHSQAVSVRCALRLSVHFLVQVANPTPQVPVTTPLLVSACCFGLLFSC